MSEPISPLVRRRRIIQWFLMPIALVTIGLGWLFPLLGLVVPVVMGMGMVGGAIQGRYFCGHLCPRGSFFDRVLGPVSRSAPIPHAFRNMIFRWIIFAALMGFMIYRLSLNPTDIYHWGRVFWMMCVVTTAIGLVLGIIIHQRSWCAFCPIGTMQRTLGAKKKHKLIGKDLCIECGKCEKACPFSLAIVRHKDAGEMTDPDCLKCPECIAVCPKQALSWPGDETAAEGEVKDQGTPASQP